MAKFIPSIADLKHKVKLCSMRERVENNEMLLTRKDVFQAWACIRPKKGSSFNRDGSTTNEKLDVQTHEIYIRYRSDFSITIAAWVFEERLKSAPRWFKVLKVENVGEASQWHCLSCRLVEEADDISEPIQHAPDTTIVSDLPRGFNL
jgi:head-tail adaptor